MRLRWLSALGPVLWASWACNGPEASGAGSAQDSETTAQSTGEADESGGLDPVPPPWDRSECPAQLRGGLEWSAAISTTPGRGGGRDLVPLPDRSVLVVDGCVSRWSEEGVRQWQVLQDNQNCYGVTVDALRQPLVVGSGVPDPFLPWVLLALDDEGLPRWRHDFDEFPGHERASAIAHAPDGTMLVAGTAWLVSSERRPWISKRAADGSPLWIRSFEPNGRDDPWLATDIEGRPILLYHQDDEGIDAAVAIALDAHGEIRWSWTSTEDGGLRLRPRAFAADWRGQVVIAGDDQAQPSPTATVVMLDERGELRWQRSALDIHWIETVSAAGFDPCGTIVLAGGGDLREQATSGQIWAAKLKLDGGLRWASFLPTTAASPDNEIADVWIDRNGAVWATGTASSNLDPLQTWVGRFAP